MKKSWIKEFARDLLALGSIPFYFLVILRSIIGKNANFLYQMVIAAIAIFLFSLLIKNSNLYIGRSVPILVFTSIFYKEFLFTIFALGIWVLLLVSSYFIKKKFGDALRGIIIGVLSTLAGYHLAPYFL